MRENRLQSSLEYLLLLGFAMIVGGVVLILVLNITANAVPVVNMAGQGAIGTIENGNFTPLIDFGQATVNSSNNPLSITFNTPGNAFDAKLSFSNVIDWHTAGLCSDNSGIGVDCWHCFFLDGGLVYSGVEQPASWETGTVSISGTGHTVEIRSGVDSSCAIALPPNGHNDEFQLNIKLLAEQ